MSPKLKRFIYSWLINTLAVLVAVHIVPGIKFEDKSLLTPFITSLVLGILNAFLRPIIMLLALPLLIFTLGLFMLVINALLLLCVDRLVQGFHVDGFKSAFLGALVIGIISLVLNSMTGQARVEIRRGRRPPGGSGLGGSGPVIDV